MHDVEGFFCKTGILWIMDKIADEKKNRIRAASGGAGVLTMGHGLDRWRRQAEAGAGPGRGQRTQATRGRGSKRGVDLLLEAEAEEEAAGLARRPGGAWGAAAANLATGMARMQPDPSGPGRREPISGDGGGSWCS